LVSGEASTTTKTIPRVLAQMRRVNRDYGFHDYIEKQVK
jgi:hypothetical protein